VGSWSSCRLKTRNEKLTRHLSVLKDATEELRTPYVSGLAAARVLHSRP
jgi:hypothetical protein